MNQESDESIIQIHVNQLSEHFENVQIFVSKLSEDKEQTITVCNGTGNWFSRYGQIRTWLIKQDEQSKLEIKEE